MTDADRDIILTRMTMDLRPAEGEIPYIPVVHGISVEVANAALVKAVKAVLRLGRGRLPVEVDFDDAVFVPGGAEITVSAGLNRFLKAKATAVVGISAGGSETIGVEVAEVRTLGKLPIEGIVGPMIEKGLAMASQRPGITIDPSRKHGLQIDPNILLQSQGIPLEFARPGRWSVETGARRLTARFDSAE